MTKLEINNLQTNKASQLLMGNRPMDLQITEAVGKMVAVMVTKGAVGVAR